MTRTFPRIALVTAVFLAGSAWGFQKGSEKRSTFRDNIHGFSIELPKFPGSAPNAQGVVLIASGPSTGKFSPNVNVMVQGVKTTARAYTDLSLGQMKQLGMKIHSQKTKKVSGRDAIELDYEGSVNGSPDLRFLSLSMIDKDRVIVVTCTVPPDDFAAGEAEYRACIDSLKLD
ncbi:MAG: hypothetical protein ACYC61_33435 [Isosphaeraceae bacterium]